MRTNETLQYYNHHADSFVETTYAADMTPIWSRFLAQLPAHAEILDLGCGSGRDARAFDRLGYRVDAVDGSASICQAAAERTGLPVRQMLFEELDAKARYDGVWACASILHLPRHELADVLRKIAAALKPGGVLYTSFKYGTTEGMRAGRYFTDFTKETLPDFWGSVFGDDAIADDAAAGSAVADDVTADDVVADGVAVDDVIADDAAVGSAVADDVTADDVVADGVAVDDVIADDAIADDAIADGEVAVLRLFDVWITGDVRPGREERWINLLARRV